MLYSMAARTRVWCYARGIFRTRKLPGTVISVGNLTVGGTGKTPMVLWIAERLAGEGKERCDPHAWVSWDGARGRARRAAER